MVYLSYESHNGWLERVLIRYLDVNFECASFIWCSRWSLEAAHQLSHAISQWLDFDVRVVICFDVCQFFAYPASSMACHDGMDTWVRTKEELTV